MRVLLFSTVFVTSACTAILGGRESSRGSNDAGSCDGGACLGDCAGVTCSTPPATACLDAHTLRSYVASGTCSMGGCSYANTDASCPGGCANAACTPVVHDHWATVAPMPTARWGLGAALGTDGRIYAIGGNDGAAATGKVEAYTPATNAWAAVTSMPTARSGLAVVAGQDGKIYAIGGLDGGGISSVVVEAYDPGSDSWETRASMPTARYGVGGATASDGSIYVLGGINIDFYAVAEIYTPSTDSWTSTADMTTARYNPAVAHDAAGRIYAIDGAVNGSSPLSSVEVHVPGTAVTWTLLAPTSIAAESRAAALAPDGRIFVMGGATSQSATVEAYTQSTNSWATVASMPTGRSDIAVVTGADGLIYALGGSAGATVATVEVYTP